MKKANILLAAGLLFSLLFAGRLAAQPASAVPADSAGLTNAPAHFWLTQRLTTPSQFSDMGNHSLALDSNGRPHIAYGEHSVYYAWYDGVQWQREIVDDIYHDSGASASLALDSNNVPHIAYLQKPGGAEQALRYATRVGNHWYHLALDRAVSLNHVAIAADSAGRPHIVYTAGQSRGLRHVYLSSQGWINEQIAAEGAGYALSFALDTADRPHIGYIPFNGPVRYTTWDGGQWHFETISTLATTSQAPPAISLALDPQNQPAVAYQSRAGVRYAARATNWTIETINNDAFASWLSLALDANAVPHLSYYDSHLDGLVYATRPVAAWQTTPVDTLPDSGRYNALALDLQGQPVISYRRNHSTYAGLQVARLANSQWVIETADTPGYDTAPQPLAIDSEDRLHLIYYDSADQLWLYRYQTAAGWETETVNILHNGPYLTELSFVLDANGQPHLTYFDTLYNLQYAYRANDQWLSQLVTEGNGSLEWGISSLALDSEQKPHIALLSLRDTNVQYFYPAGDNWQMGIVDTFAGSYESGEIALKLDALDRPHIVYAINMNAANSLTYAHRPDDQWLLEEPIEGFLTSPLALDSQGHPHLLFRDFHYYYAYWTGSEWSTQSLEFLPDSAVVSIALDSQDRPHLGAIGYVDYYNFLNYLFHDGSQWVVQQADIGYRTGNDLSLALNSQDAPFILHQDPHNGHIKLSQLATSITYSPLILNP